MEKIARWQMRVKSRHPQAPRVHLNPRVGVTISNTCRVELAWLGACSPSSIEQHNGARVHGAAHAGRYDHIYFDKRSRGGVARCGGSDARCAPSAGPRGATRLLPSDHGDATVALTRRRCRGRWRGGGEAGTLVRRSSSPGSRDDDGGGVVR
jgi:hypothetical protein